MRYAWDERKNLANQQKHGGISIELAALVFDDEYCLIGKDRVDENGEQRWIALGAVSVEADAVAVLVVIHAYRENRNGEEIVRIISARRAEKHERRSYQEQAID
ncbi:MAG: BrnT family toxin [Terracidiphilus sp.]